MQPRSFLAAVLVACLAAVSGAAAVTDMVECARPLSALRPGDVCYGVVKGLEDAGFIPDAFQEPLTSDLRIVPPPSGPSPPFELETTWTFASDGGLFNFTFGVCIASAFEEAGQEALYARVQAETASDDDQREFAITCINGSTVLFDDLVEDPVVTKNISVPVAPSTLGDQVIFYLMPNDRVSTFLDDPEGFWVTPSKRRPLFSVNGANPGYLSQLVLFHNHTAAAPGECPCDDTARTAFMWEDKTRSNRQAPDTSDADYGDMVFVYQGLVQGQSEFLFFCDRDGSGGGGDACKVADVSSAGKSVTMSWGPAGTSECSR